MSQFHGRMHRVGRYGPRCSTRWEDRWGEMMADDYRSPTLGRAWDDVWRQGVLDNLRAPLIYLDGIQK